MDGIGFQLKKSGADWYYHCNINNYRFSFLANPAHYTEGSREVPIWDESDGDGTPVGDPAFYRTEYFATTNSEGISYGSINSHYNSNVKKSAEYQDHLALDIYGKLPSQVEWHGEIKDIQEEYEEDDWSSFNGDIRQIEGIIGYPCKHMPNDRLMLIKE